MSDETARASIMQRLRELVALFGLLGIIGFGGPAAHIALMRREVVDRRGWMTDQGVMDLVGLTSLIPGPNSTELAMLIGRQRAGLRGLLVAGLAFILPAAAIVLALAWAYVTYGATPAGEGLLYGLKPVLLAVVAAAILSFGRVSTATPLSAAIAVGAALGWMAGLHELLVLGLAAVVMAAIRLWGMRAPALVPAGVAMLGLGERAVPVDLPVLFAVFLKAGALLFGSGYLLLAYLRGDLVERLGWLTDQQLLDAVAIGQVTPGPLFTTATFVGYLLAGIGGAVVATVAIFLPAFIVSALIGQFAGRLRDWPLTAALLDGLNAGAVGLMVVVSAQLALSAIVDPLTVALAAGSAIALLVWSPSSVLLLVLGGAIGLAAAWAGIGP